MDDRVSSRQASRQRGLGRVLAHDSGSAGHVREWSFPDVLRTPRRELVALWVGWKGRGEAGALLGCWRAVLSGFFGRQGTAVYDRSVVSRLGIRLLGRPEIERDGVVVAPPRGHKAWGVLAYLVLAERPVARARLAGLVFGEADDPLGALRWTLAQLRRALGVPARTQRNG